MKKLKITESARTCYRTNALHAKAIDQWKISKVKLIQVCCLRLTMICVAINNEYRTGSKVDSLWVQASVAEGSALPWKIGHLGASWRTTLPRCATTTQVPTGSAPPPARIYWTKAVQMVPLPTHQQPLRTAHSVTSLLSHSSQA